MSNPLILNVIHRPEMVPEYAETVMTRDSNGAEVKSALVKESLDIFRLQQEIAHKNNIKTTIQMTYASLFSKEAVSLAKEHHEIYGDEIALTLLGLPCEQFREKYKTKDFCIWMFSKEDKIAIIEDVFEKFYACFGFYPASTGSYYMDAWLINQIKQRYPSVRCAVATCFEEGPKAYHTCNNSWYTLMDGGPWNPWIPSKQNTHAPAANEEEDSGIVAIPHLSRDLLACFDGNGSNFGTHPQNVLRGMIYQDGQYPYLFNLIDQYRHLAKYNRGFAYNMMFVGPGWMNKLGRWEAPYSLLVKSYEDDLAYYAQLKRQGELVDLTMSELADVYRKTHTYHQPECALWHDILYGSEKQQFWYCDPFLRATLDMNQGGAIIDLRPYVAKLDTEMGIGTRHIQDVSYPFLIQAHYRAGYFTHYAGEGTVKSCKISYGGEEADLCLTRTKAHFTDEGDARLLTLDPVELKLGDLTAMVQTTFRFREGSAAIEINRSVLSASVSGAKLKFNEYMTACYGTTEYPEDMTGITLSVSATDQREEIEYAYRCREAALEGADEVRAVLPQIETAVKMTCARAARGYVREGYAFSPMFTLGYEAEIGEGETLTTWLSLEKVN